MAVPSDMLGKVQAVWKQEGLQTRIWGGDIQTAAKSPGPQAR